MKFCMLEESDLGNHKHKTGLNSVCVYIYIYRPNHQQPWPILETEEQTEFLDFVDSYSSVQG